MAESRVIFLIVAAIVAGSLLLLSTNVLQGVKTQIGNIIQVGETQQAKFNPGGLYSACNYWLTMGSERYNSKVILETVKVPSLMSPYSNLRSCCSEELERAAKDCYQGKTGRDCAGNGYLDAESSTVLSCVKACENIMRIYDICHTQCPNSEYYCMDQLILYQGRDICRGEVSYSESLMSRICGG